MRDRALSVHHTISDDEYAGSLRRATGSEIFPLSIGCNHAENEMVTVEGPPEDHPPYELWCTDDEDGLFLKGGEGGYMQTYSEIVELER